jgi:hypothetical protein
MPEAKTAYFGDFYPDAFAPIFIRKISQAYRSPIFMAFLSGRLLRPIPKIHFFLPRFADSLAALPGKHIIAVLK